MDEQLRHRVVGKADRVQHDQPVNSVRRNENVFANDLQRLFRPTIAKFLRLLFVIVDLGIVTGETDVVRERIEPDVSDEIFVERQLDSPIKTRFRARDAKVRAGLAVVADSLNRVAQFGLAKIGNDRVFAIVDVTKQPVFVLAQFEIIVFFLAKLDLSPLRSKFAVLAAFLVSEKLFLANRVIPGLLIFVDFTGIEQPLQHSLHDFFVARIDRLCPAIVFHIQLFPKIDKLLGHAFDEFRWWNARLRSRLLHFLTVLIDPG